MTTAREKCNRVISLRAYSGASQDDEGQALHEAIIATVAELREKEKHMVGISVSRDPSRSTVTLCDGDRVPRDLESAIRVLEGK